MPPVEARRAVTRQPTESIKNVMDRTPLLGARARERASEPSRARSLRTRPAPDTWSIGRDDYAGTHTYNHNYYYYCYGRAMKIFLFTTARVRERGIKKEEKLQLVMGELWC